MQIQIETERPESRENNFSNRYLFCTFMGYLEKSVTPWQKTKLSSKSRTFGKNTFLDISNNKETRKWRETLLNILLKQRVNAKRNLQKSINEKILYTKIYET